MNKLGVHQKAVLKIFGGVTKCNGDNGSGVEVNSSRVHYGFPSECEKIVWSLFDRGLLECGESYYVLSDVGREVVKYLGVTHEN